MRLRDLLLGLCLVAPQARADMLADEGLPPHERCALCHGLYGDAYRDKFPKLAAQRPAYIERQINAFLSGARSNDGGQMVAVVTEIAPEHIPQVAAWFAAQDPPPPAAPPEDRSGEILYVTSGCLDCHDETAAGKPEMPYLSAQHAAYLAKQMREFRDGARPDRPKERMRETLRPLSDTQIAAIAAYLASRERGSTP
ncbi:MAG: c-type cytochrome [Pseudomonadota bacterium]|jgi:cytochrome c553|nr:c-type cytochrome [Pseudomonadota bacterium]